MKLPKSFVKAEKMRLDLYKELGITPHDDPSWIENIEIITNEDYGKEREEGED